MQECAKIHVNKCELAKKRIAIFSDVCFFLKRAIRHKIMQNIPDIWPYPQLSVLLHRQTMEQREQNRMNSSYAESRQSKTEGQI